MRADPSHDERRPRQETALNVNHYDLTTRIPAAELACRVALLRVRADQAYRLDHTGWLTAQLRDLADLLEVAERERWFW